MAIASNEVLQDAQLQSLEMLKNSIANDPTAKAEAAALGNVMTKGTRTEAVTALRVLETTLTKMQVIDKHRAALTAAQTSVANYGDMADAGLNKAAGIVQQNVIDPTMNTVVKPVLNAAGEAIKKNVPGGTIAVDALTSAVNAIAPHTETVKKMYDTMPTWARLPVLGAAVGGTSYLASFPVKLVGWLVSFVSKKGGDAMKSLATTMQTTGKFAFLAGIGLGAASRIETAIN